MPQSNPAAPVAPALLVCGEPITDAQRAEIAVPLSVKGTANTRAYCDYMVAKTRLSAAWKIVETKRGAEFTKAAQAYNVEKAIVESLKQAASVNWSRK